jgi:hypothetical protein
MAWVWVCLCANAAAQIVVPHDNEPHAPIVATLSLDGVPAGAQIRGGWQCSSGCAYLDGAEKHQVHIWAPPGTHTLSASGVWVLTEPVEIAGKQVQVLVDFGQYSYSAQFQVGQGDDQPQPNPTPTPGKLTWVVVIEESGQRTPQQAVVISQLREWCRANKHPMLLIDKDSVGPDGRTPSYLASYLQILQRDGISVPALLAVLEGRDGKTAAAGRQLPGDAGQAVDFVESYQ